MSMDHSSRRARAYPVASEYASARDESHLTIPQHTGHRLKPHQTPVDYDQPMWTQIQPKTAFPSSPWITAGSAFVDLELNVDVGEIQRIFLQYTMSLAAPATSTMQFYPLIYSLDHIECNHGSNTVFSWRNDAYFFQKSLLRNQDEQNKICTQEGESPFFAPAAGVFFQTASTVFTAPVLGTPTIAGALGAATITMSPTLDITGPYTAMKLYGAGLKSYDALRLRVYFNALGNFSLNTTAAPACTMTSINLLIDHRIPDPASEASMQADADRGIRYHFLDVQPHQQAINSIAATGISRFNMTSLAQDAIMSMVICRSQSLTTPATLVKGYGSQNAIIAIPQTTGTTGYLGYAAPTSFHLEDAGGINITGGFELLPGWLTSGLGTANQFPSSLFVTGGVGPPIGTAFTSAFVNSSPTAPNPGLGYPWMIIPWCDSVAYVTENAYFANAFKFTGLEQMVITSSQQLNNVSNIFVEIWNWNIGWIDFSAKNPVVVTKS